MNEPLTSDRISKRLHVGARSVGTALIILLVLARPCLAQDGVTSSFAYLANGEIHASCETGDVLVTDVQFIESFAIDGATLAVVRRMENDTGWPDRLFVIDLKSRRIISGKKTVGAATVRDTCGSLVLEHFPEPGDITPAATIDIKTDRRLESSLKNVGLSCSRDRNVIAYLMLNEQDRAELVVRDVLAHNSATIAEHANAVSVSPLGQVVAYRDGDKICRWNRSDQSTRCIDADAIGNWIVAADGGQVRFSATDYVNCIYHLPNMEPIVDLCVNSYSWNVNEAPILLRKKTEMLQYLEPESAKLLCKQGFSPILISAEKEARNQ
jgi:hypothetical protein